MVVSSIAKCDLKACKTIGQISSFIEAHSGTAYIVFGVRTGFQCYVESLEVAKKEVTELIKNDRVLYDEYGDECIIEDYFIVECKERLHSYFVEEKEI